MKIGIFGGSFNPPHKMHKEIVTELLKKKYLDKVIVLPTGNQYNKKGLIDYEYRLDMLKIMFKNNKNVIISDYECKGELKYTYQSLDYFRSVYPDCEIYFICGTDNLSYIDKWRNSEYIINNYKILVIKRRGDDINALTRRYSNIIVANIKMKDISSTNIRNNILKDLSKEIDKNVYNYIKKNNLYI